MRPHSIIQTQGPLLWTPSRCLTQIALGIRHVRRGLALSQGWFCCGDWGVCEVGLLWGGPWRLLVLLFPPAGHLEDWTTEKKPSP